MSRLREAVLGPFLRAARHVWKSDRFLWPAARVILRGRSNAGTEAQVRTADGFRMSLRLGEYPDGAMYFGVFEVRTVRLMRKLVRPGDVVLDVGANIGYMTLHLARLVGPGGHVHSFEPMPPNVQRLRRVTQENGFSQVTIHEHAVGESEGTLPIYSFADADQTRHALASMAPLYGKNVASECQVKPLDAVIDREVRLIKLDVEGAEVGALRGARATIARWRPHIIVERNAAALGAFGHTFADVYNCVRDVDPSYRVRNIDRNWATLDDAAVRAGELPDRDSNFWLCPGD